MHFDDAKPEMLPGERPRRFDSARYHHAACNHGGIVAVDERDSLADLRLVSVGEDLWYFVTAEPEIDRAVPCGDLRQQFPHSKRIRGNNYRHLRKAAKD